MRAHTTLLSSVSQLCKGACSKLAQKHGQGASPSGSGVDAVPQEGDLIQGQFVAQPEADRYFHP